MKDRKAKADDRVEQALARFLESANLGILHHLDKEKFDEFTVTVFENGNRWKVKDVERRLLDRRLKKEILEELLSRFEIGIEVLTQQRELKQEALTLDR